MIWSVSVISDQLWLQPIFGVTCLLFFFRSNQFNESDIATNIAALMRTSVSPYATSELERSSSP